MKIILLFAFCFFSFHGALASFDDTQYSWYRDAIETLQKDGLVDGIGNGKYGPDLPITRAEILTMLLRSSETKLPVLESGQCFPDVQTNKWYHQYICGAHLLGIANGFGNGKFQPNASVTTLEAIAFGIKAFGINVDTDEDKEWYEPLQQFAQDQNIMPTHSYTLGTKISRGKAAELIVKLREYKKKNTTLDYKSSGCSVDNTTLGDTNLITIGENEREYILSVPSGYTNNREYGLIIATHGRTNNNAMVRGYMGLDRQSDALVAYPAGLASASGKSFSWSEAENMTLIDAILKEVSENYCINRDKVSIVGHSLGGWMAQRIACLRGEFVSGLAVVGSGGFVGACSGPVPSLFFQNVDDHLSSYESGISARTTRLKVNECDESQTEDIQIGSLTCTKYTACSPGNEVVWCEGYTGYNNDPHSWPTPNGGKDILEYLNN